MMQRGSSMAPQTREENEVQAKLQEESFFSQPAQMGTISTQGHITP